MYIIKNALKNLIRNKNRNIMIGVIIFVIILTTVVALVINNTASNVIDDYKSRFGSKVTISPNMEKFMQQDQGTVMDGAVVSFMPEISSEQYLKFADSEYLQKSIVQGRLFVDSSDVTAVGPESAGDDMFGGDISISGDTSQSSGVYTLIGDDWKSFEEGIRAIESGDYPKNDNECMISTDLKEQNQLELGDTVNFTTTLYKMFEIKDYPEVKKGDLISIDGNEFIVSDIYGEVGKATKTDVYALKIAGIYKDFSEPYSEPNLPKVAMFNNRNEVYTTLNTIITGKNADESGIRISATYYLKNPDLLPDFEKEIRTKGLDDVFDVTTDATSYNNIVKPVMGLKQVSLTFMIVVIILGSIILLLITSLSIRERKYEIGVLRAMGMKKAKVALGLWTEILAITGICLVLGLGVGTVISQPVSDIILQKQVEAVEENNQQISGGGSMSSFDGGVLIGEPLDSNVKPLNEMKVTLNWVTIIEIVAISFLLASLAGAVSISKITKYEPIKILMERN